MNYEKYDYSIKIKQLQPSIGGVLKFVAKIGYIYKIEKAKPDKKIKHNFGECYGKTREEAHEKMKNKIEEWICKQNAKTKI